MVYQSTWGLDAGAAMAIISHDLDEIFALSDRMPVIAGGRVSEPVLKCDATVESIGRLMGGMAAVAVPRELELAV